MKNCKETSTLVTQSLDRKLTFRESAGMYLHLMICRNCTRFMKQMQQLRVWLQHEDEGTTQAGLGEEARKRITRKLQEEE